MFFNLRLKYKYKQPNLYSAMLQTDYQDQVRWLYPNTSIICLWILLLKQIQNCYKDDLTLIERKI